MPVALGVKATPLLTLPFQVCVLAPEALNVTALPAQMVLALVDTTSVGTGLTLTDCVALKVQDWASVTVSV